MSDNEDQGFQDLGQEYPQILQDQDPYQTSKPNHTKKYGSYGNQVPTQSTIRYRKHFLQKIYKVKIQQGENLIDIKILQSQFYILKLYHKDNLLKDNLKRRYSDFDMLFQLLEKRYPGFLFPAFPEKGILSYVKTKVTVAKDEKLIKTRIKMIERFLNIILNEEKFNPEKCSETKKFFEPEAQFEFFKKTARQEINNSKSIVDSTWGIIKDFFKMSQTTKYTSMVEEIKKEKLPFEELLAKTQEFSYLITDELEANGALCEMETNDQQKLIQYVPEFQKLRKTALNYSSQLNPVSDQLSELEFNLQCENEDYLMALKKIEIIEQMKQSQQNYKNLSAIESEFGDKLNELKMFKKEKFQKLNQNFSEIVKRVYQIQRDKE